MPRRNISMTEFLTSLAEGRVFAWLLLALLVILAAGILGRELGERRARRTRASQSELEDPRVRGWLKIVESRKPWR
jgi:hypothetical protein